MKILVVTGDHFAPDPEKRGNQFNEEDMVTHQAMVDALKSFSDLEVEVLNDHRGFLDRLRENPPDLMVNFCDTGYQNDVRLELHVPAYAELLGVPYTGSPPAAIVTCYDKAVVRMMAESLGIAVPRESFHRAGEEIDVDTIIYPSLIKPNKADGSLGITKDAVVRSPTEARRYLEWLTETLPDRDILIQEYLPGPEYGLGVIGNANDIRFLPVLEVDFSRLPEGLNPILSYESKAHPDSPYWTDIGFRPASLPDDETREIIESAGKLFGRLGLRDYARFDWRRSEDGRIRLMEVNPNPAWANDGKLAYMAGMANIEYHDMLRMIINAAVKRSTS